LIVQPRKSARPDPLDLPAVHVPREAAQVVVVPVVPVMVVRLHLRANATEATAGRVRDVLAAPRLVAMPRRVVMPVRALLLGETSVVTTGVVAIAIAVVGAPPSPRVAVAVVVVVVAAAAAKNTTKFRPPVVSSTTSTTGTELYSQSG
jgi:hypothetical protein